jgi:hypothetical protein
MTNRRVVSKLARLLLVVFICFQFIAPLLFTKKNLASNNHSQDDEKDEVNNNIAYPNDGFPQGILSHVAVKHLRALQLQVDEDNHTERCRRYGYYYNNTAPPKRRRIFYGANIANEPWEIFEIVAAEAYGIFEGMVFVESNRTQNSVPRPLQRIGHAAVLSRLFGIANVQVRTFVNEHFNIHLVGLDRENAQRYEILKGWKEMGMTAHDVGYIADPDETFSRDFLRAAQVCDGIDAFNYDLHRCGRDKVKLISTSRSFEMVSECVRDDYHWPHPDMVIGACIELIADEELHPVAARDGSERKRGFGKYCRGWTRKTNVKFPPWNPYDFRMMCGKSLSLPFSSIGQITEAKERMF